jgi:hypothetical protein
MLHVSRTMDPAASCGKIRPGKPDRHVTMLLNPPLHPQHRHDIVILHLDPQNVTLP